MNESSLSQQLREAITKIQEIRWGGLGSSNPHMDTLLKLIPQFLTEHEALQRKADAGEALLVCVDNHSCDGQGDCWVSMDAFATAYREATKPSDI